jgi:hypothetical protein
LANDADNLVDGDGVHIFERNRRLLNMAGITHLIQSFPEEAVDNLPALGFKVEAQYADAGTIFRLYRNPDAFPKAYLVPRAAYLPDLDKVLHAVGQPAYNPAELIYINQPGKLETSNELKKHSVVIQTYTDTRVEVAVDTEQAAWLVVTDSPTPEWHTFLDDQPAPSLAANSIFRAAYVPAGHHTITFQYSSPAAQRALMLSVASLIIAVILLLPVRSNYASPRS